MYGMVFSLIFLYRYKYKQDKQRFEVQYSCFVWIILINR